MKRILNKLKQKLSKPKKEELAGLKIPHDISEIIEHIKHSKLFDEDYYISRYLENKSPKEGAILHYLQQGANKHYNPNDVFDTNYYLETNSDVKDAQINPLLHFIIYGWKEGRNPSDKFNTNFYLNLYTDVRAIGINPLYHYLNWGKSEGRLPVNKNYYDPNLLNQNLENVLIDISQFSDNYSGSPGKVAVHCHIFYFDLINEFSYHLNQIPFPFDAFISVTSEEGKQVCTKELKKIRNITNLKVVKVFNRGRDIAPMLCEFGEKLKEYDYIAHIQSKKSLYNNGATNGWREYLFNGLFGTEKNIKRIFKLFSDNEKLGIIYPQGFTQLPYMAYTWLANKSDGAMLCARMGIKMPEGYFNFPAGSMFWAKGKALRPLLDLNLKWEDFPEEKAQTDGTIAHAIERLIGAVPTATGYSTRIIKDPDTFSWSPFRIDQQYLPRKINAVELAISDEQIKIVAFDIFDTLLVRPLINPDHTKQIVIQQLKEKEREVFKNFRAQAEVQARLKHGRDIGINEIYSELSIISGLKQGTLHKVKELEEQIELASVGARNEAVEVLKFALRSGKRVILVSDMFLRAETINRMLVQNNITGWHKLYLSSTEGTRKDTGKLYAKMLETEGVKGEEVLMVGDNERSDIQIPSDHFGMKCLHILRANDLAMDLPSYAPFVNQKIISGDLNKELTISLIVQNDLNKISDFSDSDTNIFAPEAYKTGFNVVGPIVLGFCQWLIDRAKQENIDKLYFLAREGKLIKEIYDSWAKNTTGAPKSYYLQVSRRTVCVPQITNIEDVWAIAQSDFFPNEISSFLFERFGIELSDKKWEEIYEKRLWGKNKSLEIKQKNIEEIKPLMEHLFPEILKQAGIEKNSLLKYLDGMELMDKKNVAIVDVGYSCTIQKSLNILLPKPIHGFYFATSHLAENNVPNGVIFDGCYVHKGIPRFENSKVFTHSFPLEKLLSANDPQIIKYILSNNGKLQKIFKTLREAESNTIALRNKLQEGVNAYTLAAVKIKKTLHPSFRPDTEIANTLYSRFIEDDLLTKNSLLEKLVLDDDYCGRGLIS